MNRLQLLLTKLAEECSEVAQRALKAQQFGLEEIQAGTSVNNADRLNEELGDVTAIVEMLNDEFDLDFEPDPILIKVKKDKVNEYAKYTAKLGL